MGSSPPHPPASPEPALPKRSHFGPKDIRNAWLIWAGVIVVICAIGIATGYSRDATGDQVTAAHRWIDGVELYSTERLGYYYPPQSVLIFMPFALAPLMIGATLWRIVSIGGFALGAFRLSRVVGRETGDVLFPVVTLVSIAPMLDAARNGQATVLMTAAMLLAAASLADERWWRAAVFLVLGVVLKPLALVLLLLVAALYPLRMAWRVAIAVLVAGLVPFLAQTPEYVIQQYASMAEKYIGSYGSEGTRSVDVGTHADLFSMLYVFGLNVPDLVQTAARLFFAVGALGLGYLARRRYGRAGAAALIFMLAALYLMLFNPLNENNTYALLAPALGLLAAHAFLVSGRTSVGVAMVVASILITANYELTRHITPEYPSWLAPLVTLPIAGLVGVGILLGWGAKPRAEAHSTA